MRSQRPRESAEWPAGLQRQAGPRVLAPGGWGLQKETGQEWRGQGAQPRRVPGGGRTQDLRQKPRRTKESGYQEPRPLHPGWEVEVAPSRRRTQSWRCLGHQEQRASQSRELRTGWGGVRAEHSFHPLNCISPRTHANNGNSFRRKAWSCKEPEHRGRGSGQPFPDQAAEDMVGVGEGRGEPWRVGGLVEGRDRRVCGGRGGAEGSGRGGRGRAHSGWACGSGAPPTPRLVEGVASTD